MPWSKLYVCFLSVLPIHPSRLLLLLKFAGICILLVCLSSALRAVFPSVEQMFGDEDYMYDIASCDPR